MNSEIQNPVAKTACAWGAWCTSEFLAALGITSWAEAAAFFGTLYTLTLLGEFWWKKFWRPLFETRGWFGYGVSRDDTR